MCIFYQISSGFSRLLSIFGMILTSIVKITAFSNHRLRRPMSHHSSNFLRFLSALASKKRSAHTRSSFSLRSGLVSRAKNSAQLRRVSKISVEILKDKTVGIHTSSAISLTGNRRNERAKTLAALMFLLSATWRASQNDGCLPRDSQRNFRCCYNLNAADGF
jgi:hypothetical protein